MPKVLPPLLETERLILRPLSVNDLNAVFKWTGDPRVNKYMIYPLYKSPEDGREWLESLYEDEKKLDYGFVLKSTGELIGSGGLYYHQDIDVWSIGYNIAYATGITVTPRKQSNSFWNMPRKNMELKS